MQRIIFQGTSYTVQEVLGNGELLAVSDSGSWAVLPKTAGRIA